MKNKRKRPMALLLSVIMIVTMCGKPVYVEADSGQLQTGLCGTSHGQESTGALLTPDIQNSTGPALSSGVLPDAKNSTGPVLSAGVQQQGDAVTAPDDGCIAEMTNGDNIYHIKTFEEMINDLKYKYELWNGSTAITLLQDVEITEPLVFDFFNSDITFDLNGKTLSGNLEESLFKIDHDVLCVFAIQNGTIRNTGSGAALELSERWITLENVDVFGDTFLTEDFIRSTKYIPTFLGGGTFTRICIDENALYHKALSEMLGGKGCYFAYADSGERVSQTYLKGDEPLENVTVKPCAHKKEDGTSAYEKKSDRSIIYGPIIYSQCRICNNSCPHAGVEHQQCQDCQLELMASLSSNEKTRYFGSFSGACQAVDDSSDRRIKPTIKLLCSQEVSTVRFSWPVTIDLNGFTLTRSSDSGDTSIAIQGNVTFQNTEDSKDGHYAGSLIVKGNDPAAGIGGIVGRLTVPAQNHRLRIDELEVEKASGEVSLSGGTFGKITVRDGVTLDSLLGGNCYYADVDGAWVDTKDKTELQEVTVTECKHDSFEAVCVRNETTGLDEWKCLCGKVTFKASVTKNGHTLYYEDLEKALAAAEAGSVLRLTEFPDAPVIVQKDVVFDFTGTNFSAISDPVTLVLKGTVTIISKGTSDSDGGITKFGIPIVVQEGGKLVVPARYDCNKENKLNFTKGIALIAGSKADFDAGTYGQLSLSGSCEVNISGGSYENIRIYETDDQNLPVRQREVTYEDFAALLDHGKAYRLTGQDIWSNQSSVKASDPLLTAKWKYIENVTVGDAPVVSVTAYSYITDQAHKENVTVQYGAQAGKEFSLRPEICFNTGAESSVTYQWYQVDDQGSRTESGPSSKTGILKLDARLSTGTHTYVVEADCNGYLCDSTPYTITVTPRVLETPIVDETTCTKVYDGTVSTGFRILGYYAGSDPDSSDAIFFREEDLRLDRAYYNAPSVGTGEAQSDRKIEYDVTILNPNYTFRDNQKTQHGICQAYITKAGAPAADTGVLTVANDQAAEYVFDFKSLLPDAPAGNYGTVEYTVSDVSLGDYADASKVTISDGAVTLPVRQVRSQEEGKAGTVTVNVKTQNYKEIPLTLIVNAVNRKLPVLAGNLTLGKSVLTYGERLDTISISGTMKDGDQVVDGTFEWMAPDLELVTGTHTAGWKFIPNNKMKYLEVTGTAEVTVNKAKLTGQPKYTPVTEQGKTFADIPLTINDSWPDGRVLWTDREYEYEVPGNAKVEANTSYYWKFEPYDKANYEELCGTLVPYVVSKEEPSSPGSDGSSSGGGSSSGSGSSFGDSSLGGGSSSEDRQPSVDDGSTIVARPDPAKPDFLTVSRTKPVTPDKTGRVKIGHDIVQSAVLTAKKDAEKNGNEKNGVAVIFPVIPMDGPSAFYVTLEARTLDTLVEEKVKWLEVDVNGVAAECLDTDLLQWLAAASGGGDILLKIGRTETFPSKEVKSAIGARPVYDMSLAYVSGDRETPVTNLCGHEITVRLHYVPAENEMTDYLCAVYVDDAGKVEWLSSSSYDLDREAVVFQAKHFSVYAVGYRDPVPAFTSVMGQCGTAGILITVVQGMRSGIHNACKRNR